MFKFLDGRHTWRVAAAVTTIAAATMLAAACNGVDSALAVATPGLIAGPTLNDPANAGLLVNSAATDFNCALSSYALAGGMVGQELTWGDLNTYDYDRRSFLPNGSYGTATCSSSSVGVYTTLSVARGSADNAHKLISGFSDQAVANRNSLLALTSAYAGYSLILLGEAMCTASVDLSPPMSRVQLWTMAEQRFTTAISEATAASDATTLNLALVGRARARINLSSTTSSKAAEAAADAQQVPANFVFNATFPAADVRSSNQVFYWINEQNRGAVDTDFWNLSYSGVADPRVSLNLTGKKAFDGITPLVTQNKYTSRSAPMPIARGTEAQLIIAEVTGGGTAVAIINALHTKAGLPPFNSTDATAIHNQVVEERRREFFLEGQELGDMIRFGLPFVPAAGTAYKSGLTYGSMTCFPYPDVERLNNPNSGG